MSDLFTYQKKRESFGRYPIFEDAETTICYSTRQQKEVQEKYALRNPNKLVLDNNEEYSEHSVSINSKSFVKMVALAYVRWLSWRREYPEKARSNLNLGQH